MRAILGSYDSELTPAEYSPQLTRRMREAEDMVQKVHAHSSEMEVSVRLGGLAPLALLPGRGPESCAGAALHTPLPAASADLVGSSASVATCGSMTASVRSAAEERRAGQAPGLLHVLAFPRRVSGVCLPVPIARSWRG